MTDTVLADCTSPNGTESAIIYDDGGSNAYQYCNGSTWIKMKKGLPLGFCGDKGNLKYSFLLHVYTWCDGTFKWATSLPGLGGFNCNESAQKYNWTLHRYEFCGGISLLSIP